MWLQTLTGIWIAAIELHNGPLNAAIWTDRTKFLLALNQLNFPRWYFGVICCWARCRSHCYCLSLNWNLDRRSNEMIHWSNFTMFSFLYHFYWILLPKYTRFIVFFPVRTRTDRIKHKTHTNTERCYQDRWMYIDLKDIWRKKTISKSPV